MGKIKMLAGDFLPGTVEYHGTTVPLYQTIKLLTGGERKLKFDVKPSDFEEIAVASEETVKKIGGAVGWGAAGALVLGPVGLLAGALLGGKKQEVTFVVALSDGKKFMASTDAKTFTALQAAAF